MAAMVSGEVGAVMAPRAQIEAHLVEGFCVHQPPLLGLSRGSWTVGVAVSQQHRDLGYAVDFAIETALEDGRIAKVFADHSLTFLPPER